MSRGVGAQRSGDKSSTAVVYCRISDDREGLALGVQRQEQDCRARAKREGLEVTEVYVDNDRGASAHSKKTRPKFQQMLDDIEDGHISTVIAYSNSRLTRRRAEFENLIQLHQRTGVRFLTVVSGDDDLSTADGRMVASIKASVDAAESERISERVRRQVAERAKAGRPHGGRRPFGWRDRVSLDPAEHAVIVECAQRVIEGESLLSIARDLTARGVPRVAAAPAWTPTVLRQMLSSPRMIGYTSRNGEREARGIWEPALDETTWRLLCALFRDPARHAGGHVRTSLLPGLVLCDECRAPMTAGVHGGRQQYICRPCKLWRSRLPVDDYVQTYVIERLRHVRDDPDPPETEGVGGRAEFLRAKIKATKRVFTGDDTVSPDELRDILRELRAELAAEEAKLVPASGVRRRRVLRHVDADEFPSYPLDRRRAIIDVLCEVRLKRQPPGRASFDPDSVVLVKR